MLPEGFQGCVDQDVFIDFELLGEPCQEVGSQIRQASASFAQRRQLYGEDGLYFWNKEVSQCLAASQVWYDQHSDVHDSLSILGICKRV